MGTLLTMSYWAIAQTHPQRESAAFDHLKRQGFHAYLPCIEVKKRRAPLFPGYLFVRIESVWYPIQSTRGVMRVLRNGNEEPSRIGDLIVRKIREREVRGIVKLPKRLQPGMQVRILRGTFKDFIGIYDGMNGKERERVLLELLGRKVPIEIHPDDLALLNVAP